MDLLASCPYHLGADQLCFSVSGWKPSHEKTSSSCRLLSATKHGIVVSTKFSYLSSHKLTSFRAFKILSKECSYRCLLWATVIFLSASSKRRWILPKLVLFHTDKRVPQVWTQFITSFNNPFLESLAQDWRTLINRTTSMVHFGTW